MKWNNVKPDISAKLLNEVSTEWSAIDLIKLISYTAATPLIIFPEHVRVKIKQHLTSKNVELGGLLFGKVVSLKDLNEGIVWIEITDSIESIDFESTSVSLSMGASIWQAAEELNNATNFVVGWYHSHPNLGAFFSSVDRKTQRDFFNSAYSLGLVIDTIKNEEKWFLGADSIELEAKNIINCFASISNL